MEISNFSSLIEVATTLSIALVAIEYVKTYTKVLCNQVFKFQDYICSSFRECMQILVDKETLEHIQPTNIEGMSTNNMIERLKRSREKLSNVHIPADTRSAFPLISVHSPVSIQYRWQS